MNKLQKTNILFSFFEKSENKFSKTENVLNKYHNYIISINIRNLKSNFLFQLFFTFFPKTG